MPRRSTKLADPLPHELAPPKRNPAGRWLSGASGNPLGRRPSYVSEVVRGTIDVEEMVAVLQSIARGEPTLRSQVMPSGAIETIDQYPTPSERQKAATELLAMGYGKTPDVVQIEHDHPEPVGDLGELPPDLALSLYDLTRRLTQHAADRAATVDGTITVVDPSK